MLMSTLLQRTTRTKALFTSGTYFRPTVLLGIFRHLSSTSTDSTTSPIGTATATTERHFKDDLIVKIATTYQIPEAKSKLILKTVLDSVMEEVANGYSARMSGFGTFESYISKATTKRNPQTGDPIPIPAMRRIRFKPHQTFKTLVKEKEGGK